MGYIHVKSHSGLCLDHLGCNSLPADGDLNSPGLYESVGLLVLTTPVVAEFNNYPSAVVEQRPSALSLGRTQTRFVV